MRYRAITLSSVLILCLMWTNSAFGQTAEDRMAAMENEIVDMKAVMERILAGRRAIDRVLADAIVLTDQDCAVLGPDWRRYEGMSGRFPLGAGEARDDRGEGRTFTIGNRGGAYLHQLTVPEMPTHRHTYRITRIDHNKADNGSDRQIPHTHLPEEGTTESGGNQPHNNMPPYHVMNFCHKAGNGN